jgi:hypothetical protein
VCVCQRTVSSSPTSAQCRISASPPGSARDPYLIILKRTLSARGANPRRHRGRSRLYAPVEAFLLRGVVDHCRSYREEPSMQPRLLLVPHITEVEQSQRQRGTGRALRPPSSVPLSPSERPRCIVSLGHGNGVGTARRAFRAVPSETAPTRRMLALASRSPLASQAEGRGFETRRPLQLLAGICTVSPPDLGCLRDERCRRPKVKRLPAVLVHGLRSSEWEILATSWLHRSGRLDGPVGRAPLVGRYYAI